jgi:hypothetical protein
MASILGVEEVLRNIKRRTEALGRGAEQGVKLAALTLQRASQELVPVDLGALKASAFTRITGTGFKTEAQIGYTSAYALYVHEAVGMVLKGLPRPTQGKYWDPQGRGQAKFLEEPARRLAPALKAIIQAKMHT